MAAARLSPYLIAIVLVRSPCHLRFMSSSRRRSISASSLPFPPTDDKWPSVSELMRLRPEAASPACSSRRSSSSTDNS